MEHISDTLNRVSTIPPSPASSAPPPTSTPTELSDRTMADLWRRMTRIFGHRWTSAYGEMDDSTWKRGLRGLTPQQIGFGLTACIRRPAAWPPTLPEFRALCTPSAEDLGLPPLDAAYREAANATQGHTWSHPAVYVAAQAVGLFELRTLTQDRSRPLFERAYEIACRRAVAGEPLSAPIPKAIQKLATPAARATVEASLDAMRKALGRDEATTKEAC